MPTQLTGGLLALLATALAVIAPSACTQDGGNRAAQPGRDVAAPAGNDGEKSRLIRVATPRPETPVTSPLRVTGEARGTWFFEASFPVRLLGADGRQIAVVPAQAQGDWMTEGFVPFEAVLEFSPPAPGSRGTLVLEKDNPSALPEHADELRIPVRFGTSRPASAGSAPADSLPAFVNRVWKVSRSAGVERGQLYTFLGDGTLLIASFHGTPMLGRWSYRRDTLTLVEEGIPHPATVLRLQADTFSIRIHGPKTPLDITFTPGATR
ncbi:MAG: Gmad2 immunoglobulin-like domain-containing protein [Gemmatimonadales bacterium]|nr:Gmad2 immunoglobulin-like domain-containing protein [Gemmatimonadales bacterium]MBA3556501.1 Gmad2 immunoglobulin-like domain-containing protein [Gemmatimonadales bacterium]